MCHFAPHFQELFDLWLVKSKKRITAYKQSDIVSSLPNFIKGTVKQVI